MKKRLFVSCEWNYPSVCFPWITGRWLGICHVWHEEETGVDLLYSHTKPNSRKAGFNHLTHNYVSETLDTCLRSSPLNKNVCTQGDEANQPLQTFKYNTFQRIPGADPALQQDRCFKYSFQDTGQFQSIQCLTALDQNPTPLLRHLFPPSPLLWGLCG